MHDFSHSAYKKVRATRWTFGETSYHLPRLLVALQKLSFSLEFVGACILWQVCIMYTYTAPAWIYTPLIVPRLLIQLVMCSVSTVMASELVQKT